MLKAIFNQVIVKPLEAEESFSGPIYVPDAGHEVGLRGEIVSIGEGFVSMMNGIFIPTTLKIGQKVVLPPMGAIKVEYKGQEYWIIEENLIKAIIEDEEN